MAEISRSTTSGRNIWAGGCSEIKPHLLNKLNYIPWDVFRNRRLRVEGEGDNKISQSRISRRLAASFSYANACCLLGRLVQIPFYELI